MDTPKLFVDAADWAHARDFGCPVGIGLRRVLSELTGDPRVGACTLTVSVPLPDWGYREVAVAWPGLNQGADVVVLVHSGPVTALMRSRICAGPALVIVVPDLGEQSRQLVATRLAGGDLLVARGRILVGQLHSLALKHPAVAQQLRAIAGPALAPPERLAQVAIIGPDAAACGHLSAELEGVEVVDGAEVDVVIALAPSRGWVASDAHTLVDAARRAGRLISTAPLPPGVSGRVVHPGAELAEVLGQVLSHPRGDQLPIPRPGAWYQAAERLHRRRISLLDARLVKLRTLATTDFSGAASGLAELVGEQGLDSPGTELPAGPIMSPLLLAALTGTASARALWPINEVIAVLVGAALAATVGWMRWIRGRREARLKWLDHEIVRIRSSSGVSWGERDGPSAWLRRELAGVQD